jgi:hypothetical protein
MKPLMLLLALMLQLAPALARDMIDEKTNEYTPYGLSIAMIAAAQVSEMKCNKKGQIDLAIAKAARLGVPIDVNDKEDYSAILLFATDVLGRAKKQGLPAWCNDNAAKIEQIIKSP